MKTEFVPKLVATVTVCCASYVVLAASDKIFTVKTLASIGYFDAMVTVCFLFLIEPVRRRLIQQYMFM